MKKRFLGILLALCMVLAFVPATAFAADTTVTVTDAAELAAAVAAGGTVKLGDDIDITSTLEINGKVTLDLNGHVLSKTGDGSVIKITSSGDLTLTDGNSAATHTDTSLPVGGIITGGNADDGGGVYNDGTFTMEGGTISGCRADRGGGVYVGSEGKFTMEGGTISGCRAPLSGGGVHVDGGGEFTMEGGTISNCKGVHGGGVCNDGTFTMEGGTISGCTVTLGNGGGVCNFGTFTMEGGTISGCTVTLGNGSGVYNYGGNFTMEGGSISNCRADRGGGVCNEMNGTLKNTSTTGGATICYGELVNNSSIEGKLVKFYNGDDLYAWEIVPENAKAVKPADPQKSGYALEGWYKETTFDNKWDFGNDTVSADMQLYANWVCEHTGGTATCTEKAKCEVCGEEYGEVDNNNHDLENIKGSAATVTETGNTEYWHCKDCDNNFSDEDGKNAIDLKDTVISKLPPEIIDGKGQSLTEGEKKELTFRSNAAYSDFVRVELDGKTVDEKNYTVKEGSTIVTLKADYVATLSVGEHTLGIVSQSGTATTTFTVNAKAVDTNSPQTGNNSHMALWFALLFVSGGALIGTAGYSKKKKHFVK